MKNKKMIAFTILIALSICSTALQAQYNSIRIANYEGNMPPPDNYLTRVRDAGYTHVNAGIGGIVSDEWDDGTYVGEDTGMVQIITATFIKCNQFGLKYIPALPGANRWMEGWPNSNNNEITYQTYSVDVLENMVKNETINKHFLLDLLLDDNNPESEIRVSNTPSYAFNADGFDKTYRSLIMHVIDRAFNATGLPSSEFDLIMLGNDEPCTYDGSVKASQKLLIGRSQDELKWMYEKDSSHFGVERWPVPEVDPGLPQTGTWETSDAYKDHIAFLFHFILTDLKNSSIANTGKNISLYDDFIYVSNFDNTAYQHGLRELIADYYKRRVQDVADFLPDVKCIFYGDLFDPEHIGGYFKTDSSLFILAEKTINVSGAATPVTEKLIFMPWLYSNTFTHELESDLVNAELRTSTTKIALGWAGATALCYNVGDPIFRLGCKLKALKEGIEIITTIAGVDISINYNANGSKYDISNTIRHFMSAGFPFMFMNSFEKEEVASHTLSQMVKMIDEPLKLSQTQRDSFMLGYAVSAFGNPIETKTNTWDSDTSAYDQHFTYNNMEIFSAAFNWHGNTTSSLMFGDVAYNQNLNIHVANNPVSVTDYFVTTKDLFNSYLHDQATAPVRTVNFYDAVQFCNELSAREGLEPVYSLSNVSYNSLWDNEGLDSTMTPYDVKGPSIIDADVSADISKSGYRLPTVQEILSIASEPGFARDSRLTEWVWNGKPESMFSLFSHDVLDTISPFKQMKIYWVGDPPILADIKYYPGDPNTGRSFRVVRRNSSLPKLAIFSRDEGLSETNISKPRIYIQNGSSVQLSNYTVHYYFTVEQDKTPVLEPYWTPGSSTSLNQLNDSLFEIVYYFNGLLDTGNTVVPSYEGNVVGLRYTDWSGWNSSNDPSFNNSSLFLKNQNIVLKDSNGVILHGEIHANVAAIDTGSEIPPDTALAISGSGVYTITPAGVELRYSNDSFHHGMMFTIRNSGLNDSVQVEWYGVRDQNNSGCQLQNADLFGNGAQINNVCTPKETGGNMYIQLHSRVTCTVQIDIFDWVNGSGCN